jgi:hypothetical protein
VPVKQDRTVRLQDVLDCLNQFVQSNVISPRTIRQVERLKMMLEEELAELEEDRNRAA